MQLLQLNELLECESRTCTQQPLTRELTWQVCVLLHLLWDICLYSELSSEIGHETREKCRWWRGHVVTGLSHCKQFVLRHQAINNCLCVHVCVHEHPRNQLSNWMKFITPEDRIYSPEENCYSNINRFTGVSQTMPLLQWLQRLPTDW